MKDFECSKNEIILRRLNDSIRHLEKVDENRNASLNSPTVRDPNRFRGP